MDGSEGNNDATKDYSTRERTKKNLIQEYNSDGEARLDEIQQDGLDRGVDGQPAAHNHLGDHDYTRHDENHYLSTYAPAWPRTRVHFIFLNLIKWH